MEKFSCPDWASIPTRSAKLKIYDGEDFVEERTIEDKSYFLLGRDKENCDIPDDKPTTSRVHAALVHHQDGALYLIDLKSTHGCSVEGDKIAPHKPTLLKPGKEFQLGVPNNSNVRRYVVALGPQVGEKRGSISQEDERLEKQQRLPSEVQASHLLVKHRDSRRPSSWKEAQVTRSKEEAIEKIKEFRQQLQDSPDLHQGFAQLASRESHCSSAKRGGDLGVFGPGQMQPAFERAAFALSVGELSGIVESDSGIHLILRTK